jgi:hypothetical protein
MKIERQVKPTLTPIELGKDDTFRFILADGTPWELILNATAARVIERGAPAYDDPNHFRGDIKIYGFDAMVRINGREHRLERSVGSQASFYEPWVIDGVRIWFDAVSTAFIHPPKQSKGIIHEKDWANRQICSPSRAARFVFQQADRDIAPEPVGKWFAEQMPVPDIRECYMGEDCWMGPYNGGAAHCGLDINMPKGTILTAPISLDDQYLFSAAGAGSNCGRWRGLRRWPDQSDWIIQSHHLMELLVPERTPISRGTPYATGAGTAVGLREHTHFMFRVIEQGGDYMIDPWILFWAAAQGEASTTSAN